MKTQNCKDVRSVAVRVLIVDDDKNINKLLKLYLEKAGYETECVFDGRAALTAFGRFEPALVLLDIMLPNIDGWDVCAEIRKLSDVPIIMLTARGETVDKIRGLELGADDYVTKPFDSKELLARVKAVLRRKQAPDEDEIVRYDNLSVNITRYETKVNDRLIEMPPRELELLYYLMSNPNRAFTRDQLLDGVWGMDFEGDARTVDVHIKRLRDKLNGLSEHWNIQTVWRVGYRFEMKA